jgi:hypothetical protein
MIRLGIEHHRELPTGTSDGSHRAVSLHDPLATVLTRLLMSSDPAFDGAAVELEGDLRPDCDVE